MTQLKQVTPAPGLELLQPLVGKWHTEGTLHEGPFGGAAPFSAVDVYEWLEGGQFLIHRLDGRFGARDAACIELFGREHGKLMVHSYYDDGKQRGWTLAPGESALELIGTGDAGDIRCELRVIEEGNALEAKWSHRQAGGAWQVFLETRGTKALPLPSASVGT